jgi:hypothetical protein
MPCPPEGLRRPGFRRGSNRCGGCPPYRSSPVCAGHTIKPLGRNPKRHLQSWTGLLASRNCRMAAALMKNAPKRPPFPFRSTQRDIQKERSPYHHVFHRTRKGAPTSLGRHARGHVSRTWRSICQALNHGKNKAGGAPRHDYLMPGFKPGISSSLSAVGPRRPRLSAPCRC